MNDRPHLLIVDDDREIRTLLGQYLDKHEFRTSVVPDGKEMRRVMERSRVDLIVLDLMLPGEDGLSICREVRTRSQVPIIMLTARGEDVDRIVGLELGADDYLAKPFNPRELLVRIKAVLRRAAHAPRDPTPDSVRGFVFNGWRLDTTTRTLTDSAGDGRCLERCGISSVGRATRVCESRAVACAAHGASARTRGGPLRSKYRRTCESPAADSRDDARAPQVIKTVYGEGYVVGVTVEAQ